MIVFPAIDLLEGQCVRLRRGDKDQKTVFSENPLAQAHKWYIAGAEWVHIVDLDGAFSGKQVNFPQITEIVRELPLRLQVGGGSRSLERAEQILALGVERVVLGTRAIEDLNFAEDAVKFFGAHRVVVGIDAKNGKVAVRGWETVTKKEVFDVATQMSQRGVRHVLYTDIERDGMMAGPNIQRLRLLALHNPELQVIASGGVSSLDDVREIIKMCDLGIEGMIIGRALYDNSLDLAEVIKTVNDAC